MTKRSLSLFCFVAMLMALVPYRAGSADFNGKIQLTASFHETLNKLESAREDVLDFYWNEPNGILSILPPSVSFTSDLAVLLVPPSPTVAPQDNLLTLSITDAAIEKKVIVVHKGTTIRFRNDEPFVHELYSPQMPGFPPEMQSTNAVRQVVFNTLGIFEVRCKRMPHLLAHVLVVATPFVARMSDQGDFSFKDLVPGEYTLQVFFRGNWIHEQKIIVEEKKNETTVFEVKSPIPPSKNNEGQI